MQKKTLPLSTQKLHILAAKLSDAKIIFGVIISVAFAIIGAALSAFNFAFNLKSAPLVAKVSAIEQRDISIEETLKGLAVNDARIESKLDRITLKLIPNTTINNSK